MNLYSFILGAGALVSSTVWAAGAEIAPYATGIYNHTRNTQGDNFYGNTRGGEVGMAGVSEKWEAVIGGSILSSDVKGAFYSTNVHADNYFLDILYKPNDFYGKIGLNYGHSKYKENHTFKHSADTYTTMAFIGYRMVDNGWHFDNNSGLRYTHIDNNKGIKDANILTAIVTTTMSKTYRADKTVKIIPTIHFTADYDFISDDKATTYFIPGTRSLYSVQGDRLHRFGMTGGFGLATQIDIFRLGADYELGWRKQTLSQTAKVNLTIPF